MPGAAELIADLLEKVSPSTATEDYAWVDTRQAWGVGTLNLAAGKTPIVILLLQAATAGAQSSPSLPMTRAEQEAFLLKARLVSEAPVGAGVRRVRLADGQREHDASLQASTSDDPSQWGYRSNVAAYELDKALDLELVSPSVERTVNGRPAALTWWADDVLMDERSRRRRGVVPPDPESWTRQM